MEYHPENVIIHYYCPNDKISLVVIDQELYVDVEGRIMVDVCCGCGDTHVLIVRG